MTDALKNKGFSDYEDFRRAVLHETGVSFCTRLHFGRPLPGEMDHYVRFAYSGIDAGEIKEGLGKLKAFLES
jgi:aspartate/methionine/tyrosine aminotransferase